MAASASPIPPYVVVIHAGSKYSPKKLNIDGGDDPFGRYQVPQLLCQVVGKGKMIKTMLLNLDTVAAALQIFPGYIAAWLGYEIGASFKYEAKKPERERGTISGDYTAEKLSTHMHKFIKQVILCRQCKLPELGLKVTGNRTKTVKVVCDSCGENYTLNRISEKFKNYITTHPPPPRKSKDEDVEKKKEQIKQMGDRSATPEPGSSSSSSSSSSSAGPEVAPTLLHDMATGEVIDLDAVADSAAERLQSSASPAVESSNVEWSVDTSEAAAESRQLALVPDAVKQLIGSSIDDTAPWLEADITDPEAILETGVLRQREHQEIISCLFARVFASLTSLERFAPVLKASAATLHKYFSKEADFQLHFLDALIPFIASSPDLLPHTKGLLHGFYQADVLEEDSILSWWQNHHQDLAHEITQAAQPFIEWLQQADSDDDDDDDDEDDDEEGNDEE